MDPTILMKPAPEIGLSKIFSKPSWSCNLTFISKVSWGSPIWSLWNMKNPVFEGARLDHHKNNQIKPFH